MRILISTWSCRHAGGVEAYLAHITSLLTGAGHDVGFAYEADGPEDRPRLTLPDRVNLFNLSVDPENSLLAAHEWRPDVIYAQGLQDPAMEEQILRIAPAVFFAHGYHGTCISGQKTHKLPVIQPCARVFGPACLALFYPRRCGGLSPLTMARDYTRQRRRLSLLRRYGAVVTHSEHMRQEFLRHGAAEGRVYSIPFVIPGADRPSDSLPVPGIRPPTAPWQLLFVGRMDRLKGGEYLLDALPRVQVEAGRPVRLTLAGDGPERRRWEQHAGAIMRRTPALGVEFAGWLQSAQLTSLFDGSDLLVMPSLWPEPYGLVGAEANRRGVPVVAYATGGIPDWLVDGENGCLAPADPPTVGGLTDAIVRCLGCLTSDSSLRQRAHARGHSYVDEVHVAALLEILRQVAARAVRNDADVRI
jgi:glycosyltransferase involved in cell wall biosynthesis